MGDEGDIVDGCSNLLHLADLCTWLQPRPVQDIISLTRLLTDKSHDPNHVRCLEGMSAVDATHEQLAKLGQDLDNERAICRKWAGEAIAKLMIQTAKELGLKNKRERPVCVFSDIGESWAADKSRVNQVKLFEIMFGMFDKHRDWSLRLEREFMYAHNVGYSEVPSPRKKGCYERIISYMKTGKVKNINQAALKTHGLQIRISRFNKDITDKNRFDKRIKGEFVAASVSIGYRVLGCHVVYCCY